MNPNAPFWNNPQQQNNQQQQFYQQQQYNPYAQQGQPPLPQPPQQNQSPQQQQQYNPYTQQQQFIQQQQFQQQQFQQQQQQQQQQYNPYAQQQFQQLNQQQQQYNPYAQPVQQQQFNQQQQQQFNQINQQNNQINQNQNQQFYNKNNNVNDNWDVDEQEPIKNNNNNNINNNNTTMNDMDKSDDDNQNQNQEQNNNQNQNQQKKKKKRRKKKKKNKQNNSNTNVNDSPQISYVSKEKEKDIKTELLTEKVKEIKIAQKQPNVPEIKKENKKLKTQNTKTVKEKEGKKEEKKEQKFEKESKKKKKKKVKWEKHDKREHLNLVLIGHVDAGKSTISGQILLATNQIDDRTILKYKKEAKEKNRESWWIAYIMDEDDEERNKGKTVECGRAHFTTDNKRYTILDAPGHKNYVPNMISGAQQADVAILVISARRGEFEAGFDRGGQTREHALLALTLGISRIVIVVNKMDTMEWSEERYNDIKKRVSDFLVDTGFKKKYIRVLPISGQDATNIKTPVSKDVCGWYKGITLIETLDSLKKVKRATSDVLRIPILDRYKGDKGLQAIGKVEAGIIKIGEQIMIMPSEVKGTIVGLSIDDQPVETAGAGENVLITFNKGTLSMDQIYSGCVICDLAQPTKVVELFEAEMYIHEIPGGGIMTKGYQSMFHSHNVSTLCEIVDIPHKLHKKTRKRSKVAPNFLRSRDSAICKIKIFQKCALEPFEQCGALGRFTLRDSGQTVVIGKITNIHASKSRIKLKVKGKGKQKKNKEQKTN